MSLRKVPNCKRLRVKPAMTSLHLGFQRRHGRENVIVGLTRNLLLGYFSYIHYIKMLYFYRYLKVICDIKKTVYINLTVFKKISLLMSNKKKIIFSPRNEKGKEKNVYICTQEELGASEVLHAYLIN